MTANPTDKPPSGIDIFKRIREHFQQASPNDVIDRVEKPLAEPDEPDHFDELLADGRIRRPTVREEWAMACPKCGSDEQIDVLASAYVRLTPDGSDADASHDGEHAWSVCSATKCCACGHSGIAREFGYTGESQPEEDNQE